MFQGNLFTVLGVGRKWSEWNIVKERGNEGKWSPEESTNTADIHKGPSNCKMVNNSRNC